MFSNRVSIVVCACVVGLALFAPRETAAQPGLDLENDTLTQSVLIHPPIDAGEKALTLWTREHTYRSQLRKGDQLARDFTVARVGDDGIPRTYRPGTGGKHNEDWFGWRRDVLAPFAGTVTRVQAPSSTNEPGSMNREAKPGLIIFEDEEGTTVVYAHVRDLAVEEGQSVERGEVVAAVGNNANSRAPHVHVGAWTGDTPLQLQVDLYAEERTGATAER